VAGAMIQEYNGEARPTCRGFKIGYLEQEASHLIPPKMSWYWWKRGFRLERQAMQWRVWTAGLRSLTPKPDARIFDALGKTNKGNLKA